VKHHGRRSGGSVATQTTDNTLIHSIDLDVVLPDGADSTLGPKSLALRAIRLN
jgi:hypothetical protein